MLACLGVLAILIKYLLKAVWIDFRDPTLFRCLFIKRLVDEGVMRPSLLNSDLLKDKLTKRTPILLRVLGKPIFWVEVLIMMIVPYPIHDDFIDKTVTLYTINWTHSIRNCYQ